MEHGIICPLLSTSGRRFSIVVIWCCYCSPLLFKTTGAFSFDLTTPRPILPRTCHAHITAEDAGNIRIGDTRSKKGLGAYATSAISSGDWVGEYFGEILTLKQVQARYWERRKKNTADRRWIKDRGKRNVGLSGDYLFDMGDELYIDGEDADKGSWCRFMNHASDATPLCNVETRFQRQIWDGTRIVQPKLWFVANRAILSGEELCYDYGDSYWDEDELTDEE